MIAPGYRGQGLGSELLDASVAIAVEHGRHTVVGSVGPRNISGRILLEHKGFHPRGAAKAVFRLAQEEHRPAEEGPEGTVEVRPGVEADLEPALGSAAQRSPKGLFPRRHLARRPRQGQRLPRGA